MKLYGYWRSSCSWRVRIALALKGLPYTYVPVNLLEGEQHQPAYREVSVAGTVPTLELTEGTRTVRLSQSLAILEYLEEQHPTPSLFPEGANLRARARMMAELVNSGIQPLQNLAVLQHVETVLKADKKAWAAHWVERGLAALQTMAQPTAGAWLMGDHPTLADVCLIPQLYAARRFGADVNRFDLLLAVEATSTRHPAFQAAHADAQPDAVKS